jgi:hypothetical protein
MKNLQRTINVLLGLCCFYCMLKFFPEPVSILNGFASTILINEAFSKDINL